MELKRQFNYKREMPSSSVIAFSPAPSSSPQGVPAQSGPVSSTSALSPIDQASQYFYRSIYPILNSANPNDLSAAREALVAALSLHLQDPKPSLMSAWLSSMIIGFTWSYLKHCRPVTAIQVPHNPYAKMPPRTRYALEAFTERIHELLEAQKDLSPEAERLLTETKIRLRKPPHAS